MSWLSKNVLDPIEKDVEGFFSSSNPLAAQVKSSAATIGSTALSQVDPIVTDTESAVEAVIDGALSKLGGIGVVAEAGVAVTYPLLTEALNALIAKKLGISPPAAPAAPAAA